MDSHRNEIDQENAQYQIMVNELREKEIYDLEEYVTLQKAPFPKK